VKNNTIHPTKRHSRADLAWLRVRQAMTDEIIGNLPPVLDLEEVPSRLNIPMADVQRGLDNGSIITTLVAGRLHLVCEASHEFLQEQGRIRMPLPESLRPLGV
jgi:hypothetical protein